MEMINKSIYFFNKLIFLKFNDEGSGDWTMSTLVTGSDANH